MTEAEAEQLAVQKRRAEGTPCTLENFNQWKDQFDSEMEEQQKQEAAALQESKSKKKQDKEASKVVDKSGRLTGFEQFSSKVGTFNLEAMEAAAENAAEDEEDMEVENEDLFDVADDDLDDIDFDDSEDEDDDSEPDI
jgi:hypothetical protein